MNIQYIPLSQLFKSAANVRTGAAEGIEELAASIQAHGLLQNLQVTRRAKGEFEVVAGGRRLAALKQLAKRKQLAKGFKVPCQVFDAENASEISLAENEMRLPMHPADQFTAFYALAQSGKGNQEIAARFGVTASVVKQRLKLASVSPRLMELYRNGKMTLDQLMAFTVSEDHKAQEAAWFDQPKHRRDPSDIRQTLTETHIEADDERVLFVGLKTYKAAGGELIRDLFQPDHEGYLTNPVLLEQLVSERLSKEAAKVQAEGWRWVETVPNLDWEALRSYGRLEPSEGPLTEKQQRELDKLTAERDALVAQHGDELDDDAYAQVEELESRIEAINEERRDWTPQDRAASGAIVSIGRDGVSIERGLLRPDEKKARLTVIEGGKSGESEIADTEKASPLSASLIEDLTSERTAALRAMMADNDSVALASLAHALALSLFYPDSEQAESCLDIRIKSRFLKTSAGNIAESGACILTQARVDEWMKRLPHEGSGLFDWLLEQDKKTVIRLIAFCASMSVDAVQAKNDRANAPRLLHSNALAASLDLDMALWWEPTKDRYIGRVSKSLILDAVTEGVSKEAAENFTNLKKDALVERACERLAGKGWLPPILRKDAPVASAADDSDYDPLAIAAE